MHREAAAIQPACSVFSPVRLSSVRFTAALFSPAFAISALTLSSRELWNGLVLGPGHLHLDSLYRTHSAKVIANSLETNRDLHFLAC